MTIALVDHKIAAQGTNGATTASIDTTGANLLVVSVCYLDGNTPTISDSKSNTWTALTSQKGFNSPRGQLYYCKNPTVGSGHTFTASASYCYTGISVAAFSGADTSAPFDVENGATGYAVSVLQTGSVTPTNDNSVLVYSAGTSHSTSIDINSVDIGTLLDHESSNNSYGYEGLSLAYQIQTTKTARNPQFTLSGSTNPTGVIAVFKVGSGGGGSTGTVAYTNTNDTLSGQGITTVIGTLAKTNSNDTLAGQGTTTVTGSLAKTNANDTLNASGAVGNAVLGTLAYTNINDTLAASGKTTIVGSLAKTNNNDTLAAQGTVPVTGTLAKTNLNDILSGQGSPIIVGNLAKTNNSDTLNASGFVGSGAVGTVSYTNNDDTVYANGVYGLWTDLANDTSIWTAQNKDNSTWTMQ